MAKHATVWRMKVKPGQVGALTALMSDPGMEAEMKGKGWEMDITGVSKNDPNEVWGAVIWYANAESPEQNASYEKMRALLAEDPEWFDCDLLAENRA
jgi:hypothetical protein